MRCLSVALISSLLVGCATGYQGVGFTGGYSETQLSENVWKVNYRGNGYSSMERVTDFNLYRCAQITIEQNYKYFLVVNENSHIDKSFFTTPLQSHSTGHLVGTGNTAFYSGSTHYSGGQTYSFSKPSSQNTIYMLNKKPENAVFVYDAEFILESIEKKYPLELGKKLQEATNLELTEPISSEDLLAEALGENLESFDDNQIDTSNLPVNNLSQRSERNTSIHPKKNPKSQKVSNSTKFSKSNSKLENDKSECRVIATAHETQPYKKAFLGCMKERGWVKKK